MDKRIHVRIDRDDADVSLKEVFEKMAEIQRENPDLDVFWDGDEYAICSRKKKK